jgi:predicted transcriptional regulator
LVPLTLKRVAITLTTLALTVIVIGCFAAQIYQQKNFRYTYTEDPVRHIEVYSGLMSLKAITINEYCILPILPLITVQAPNDIPTVLTNSTRSQIYDFVVANPGVSFRAICAGLCIPVGLSEYHLGVLVKAGLVSFVRDGRYKRFFVAKRFSKREMTSICLLRHKTAKRIIETLLCKKQLSHGKLADEVSITSQALTWQMKTLGKTEFVLQVNEGLKTIYLLDESSKPYLRTYLAIIN